eukprot:2115339-Pleurochrysis_carterae.AAC.1
MELEGSDELTDSAAMHTFLKQRFGERAANVLSILRLWEAFGRVYSAACSPWEMDTADYRAKRALTFLRAAIELSIALNKVSNYRHQSWYVHYLVWIIPQQIFVYGNLWKFSTCAIESRGAQLKKFGRKT